MTVSIVVVSRGLWPLTKQSLEGLIFTMSKPWQLVFINNGGQDETREQFEAIAPTWAWSHFEGYKVKHYKRPVSLAAAWNAGYKLTKGADFVLFANNDIVYHLHGWWDRFEHALTEGRLGLASIQEMTWYKFRFIEGSLFGARRATFEALEEKGRLFDTRFKLSCEDVDLSERALRAEFNIGQVLGLQPDYLVHVGHQTIESLAGKENTLTKMHKARVALCKKYGYEPKIDD